MKKPVISQYDRIRMLNPELEVAKMKFRREFDKGIIGQILHKIVDWLSKKINKI